MALSYPMPGWPVVSRFGLRVDPVLHTSFMHEGIDIWAPEGTPIRAAGDGTVVWAGDRHGYGNAVFIDHGRGVVTIYAHQSKVGVAVGQHVGTGATIGYIGHTGLAAGPHLHFEVRVGGVAYDPLNFVSPRLIPVSFRSWTTRRSNWTSATASPPSRSTGRRCSTRSRAR